MTEQPDAADQESVISRQSFASAVTARVAIVLLAVVPLLPTMRAAFVYDDTSVIRDNAVLRGWSALWRVWSEPYWPSEGINSLGLYRPMQLALLAAVWNLSGGSPRWFHAYALSLGMLVVLAVWWLLRRATAVGAAVVGAAWFATHPLHVEATASVANTSELVVVLATIGMIRVLWSSSAAVRGWARPAAFGMLAAVALATKESGLLAVPVAAVTAWGWAPESRSAARETIGQFLRRHEREWLVALVSVVAIVLARLVVLGAPVAHASIAAQGLSGLSAAQRVIAMMSLWPRILDMLVWPTLLAPYYGPTILPTNGAAIAALSLLVATGLAGLAVVIAKRGDRRPIVALGWIAMTYLPASNLLTATGQLLSDRTLFGATVGVALLLAWVLDRLPLFARRTAMILCVVVVARDAIVETHYAVAWTSHRALWERLADVSPNEHMSYKLLGMDARARGDTAHAVALLERALTMAPTDRQIRFELGQAYYRVGRYLPAARTLAPLMRDGDARAEPGFAALYFDAVGRAGGPAAVVGATAPYLHSETAAVAALFGGVAKEQLGDRAGADSLFTLGLRRSPGNSTLLARRAALRTGRQ